MKVLALERAGRVEWPDPAKTEVLLAAEARQAWELYQSGAIREMYFRADRHDAVLILECEGAPEARIVLASLPLVREGLIDVDVVPLRPYDGFERLFQGTETS